MMGVMIVHSISTIHDYLENEFASLDTVRETLKDSRP
jgi:hypothetical protein